MSYDDFKILKNPGDTFGNDKIVTSKNFRPSYAMSVSEETLIVYVPIKQLEDVVKKL